MNKQWGAVEQQKEAFFGDLDVTHRSAVSEHDHLEAQVKRNNLVELFLTGFEVDAYIATHLYGHFQQNMGRNVDLSIDLLGDLADESVMNVSTSFTMRKKIEQRQMTRIQKMSPFATYVALIKGYCAIAILFIPKAFQNGGWLFSGVSMLISAAMTTICVVKLVSVGLNLKTYSYEMCVKETLGVGAKKILEFMICATQFSFSISQITFIVKSLKTTVDTTFETDSSIWYYATLVFLIYTPLAWVRNISKFSFTFLIGNLLIVATVLLILYFAFDLLFTQGGGGPGLVKFNETGYLTMIGFSVYTFEGIGVVMPIMQVCATP